MEWIVPLLTLSLLEIVLGIDNIIFISILSDRLAAETRARARNIGLLLAMLMRILLLFSLSWVMKLSAPLVTVLEVAISGRDIVLFIGGLFLVAKSTYEIHDKLEGEEGHSSIKIIPTLGKVLVQIVLLDIIFSLDSVITAVGMVDQLWVMVSAVVLSVLVMLWFAKFISQFVHQHPTIKILALSFLILIGVSLIAEGFHTHIPKGYIYFAMAFSVGVEMINIRVRKPKTEPIHLRDAYK